MLASDKLRVAQPQLEMLYLLLALYPRVTHVSKQKWSLCEGTLSPYIYRYFTGFVACFNGPNLHKMTKIMLIRS